MRQLFSGRFVLLLKLGALAALAVATAAVFAWRAVTARPHALDEPVEQVVPFSHKHHAGDDGIDCRYCHTSVEDSAFAGIPPVSTCMTCHSQLYTDQAMLKPVVDSWRTGRALHWRRVHDLPDFVYFNHGAHVAHGVGCVSCHGRVDRMPLTRRAKPLTMQWCLDCHRAPARHLRPRERVFDMDWKPAHPRALGRSLMRRYHIDAPRLTDCSVCHR